MPFNNMWEPPLIMMLWNTSRGKPCGKVYQRPDDTVFTCDRTTRHLVHTSGEEAVIPLPGGGWLSGWEEPESTQAKETAK